MQPGTLISVWDNRTWLRQQAGGLTNEHTSDTNRFLVLSPNRKKRFLAWALRGFPEIVVPHNKQSETNAQSVSPIQASQIRSVKNVPVQAPPKNPKTRLPSLKPALSPTEIFSVGIPAAATKTTLQH